MRKYVITGIQGCGKGTQAKLLSEKYDLVHISVGDIFRWNVQHHTKLGARIRRIVARGELVDDEIVADIVHKRLADHDWNYGFILDGFPRNPRQAEFFLENYDIDAVINIELPDAIVMKRVLSRRLCSQCGLDYNLFFHRPEKEDTCDVCGGQLIARADDNEDAVKARIADFHAKTQPVLDIFARKELIVTVDGNQDVGLVQAELRFKLNLV
ncbi:MAG: nucleoside monophosphate kinase [Rhodocyclaceae bacterium]|nr:nucleoside monophosphate kinase [Rhodocyclaceae bacterium]